MYNARPWLHNRSTFKGVVMANFFVTPSTQPGKIAKGKKPMGGKPSKGTKKDGRMKGMPGAKSGSAPLPKGKGKGK